ncbi:MAG: peptide chain release factor N(5)-glutamine methyltransferase [Succinivibrionaceae bacterium]
MKIGELYRESELVLREFLGNKESSSIEAYYLVSYALNKDKAFILTYPEYDVIDEDVVKVRELVKQRLLGIPIAYITGYREFWSMNLKVTKDTLIPRSDTETVVEQALLKADLLSVKANKLNILDLGTGSGAIALALKKELPEANITAVDYSEGALEVAKENARNLNLDVDFVKSDWYSALKEHHQFHIIVSNPPYISEDDPHLTMGDLRFEPKTALVAPMQGMLDLLNIISSAEKYLANGGYLILEHGYNQASNVRSLLFSAEYTKVETVKDLGYNDRVTLGCKYYKNKQ